MIYLMVAIGTLITIIIGFLTAILIWNRDSRLEGYYKTVAKSITENPEYSSIIVKEIPSEIIVDSGAKISPLRAFFKRIITRLKRKTPLPVVLIFAKPTEDEQKAFLIQKTFDSVCDNKLFDIDFLESLKYYLAYKCGCELNNVDDKVKIILRRDFENSKYREYMIKLESLDFDRRIVLNPPPEPRPLLTNLVLPMVGELEKKLIFRKAALPEIEEYKSFFMEVIHKICLGDCAIIFLGIRTIYEYIDLANENLDKFNFFILAARGWYIKACGVTERHVFEEKWEKDSYRTVNIEGNWQMSDGIQVACLWKLILKIKEFSAFIPEQKGIRKNGRKRL